MNASTKQSNLTQLEQQLLHKLQESTDFLKFADGELEALRKDNAKLKAKLSDQPNLPSNFKATAGTMARLNAAKAELSAAQKQLQQEIDNYTHQQLQDIAQRNAKAAAKADYDHAVNHGSYSQATKAIQAKKQEIQQNGVEVLSNLSGSFKALIDWQDSSLFTFEPILDSNVEIQGQSYSITSAKLCPINSGNVYQFKAVRHSAR